jgi:hypothetical protein
MTKSQHNDGMALAEEVRASHTFMMLHVILTRRTLASSGMSSWQIERALRRGDIERRSTGAFVYPGVDDAQKWYQDLSVLLHRRGPKAAASHRSAARLHGLDGDWDDALDVLAPPTGGVRQSNVFRTRTLMEEHATTVDGFRTTTVERTLIDIGRFLNADQVELAVESALRGDPRDPHRWNQERLQALEAWPQTPRVAGHIALRQVLHRRVSGAIPTASAAETLMLQILRSIALDRFVLRLPLVDVFAADGRRVSGYPDFLFWQIGLAIEVDGKAYRRFASTPGQPARKCPWCRSTNSALHRHRNPTKPCFGSE